jgi:acetyl esterase/lipase
MKVFRWVFLLLLISCGCDRAHEPKKLHFQQLEKVASFAEARRGFQTDIGEKLRENFPVADPPGNMFQVVHYDAPVGQLAAYLSQPPKDAKRHPAIIWIVGGFSNSISPVAWMDFPAKNDQSASAFRKAGLIMMYPSLRGGNDNPGYKEGFFGEVDDVLAAAKFLAKQKFVDPKRIYLGGHSTGGTLVLLVAAAADRFRAVFSFGPVADPAGYGALPGIFSHFSKNSQERELRAPIYWLSSIKSPVFVFEGTGRPSNIGALEKMAEASENPLIHFHPIPGANHYSTLAPMTRLIAGKILHDQGTTTAITFSDQEINDLFGK